MHRLVVEEWHAENAAARFTAKEKIARNIHGVAQRKVLIDHFHMSGACVGGRRKGNRLAVDFDGAAIWDDGAGKYFAQRRFAGAIVSDQPQHFAGFEGQRDIVQRLNGIVTF